jgi:hypothetical protein
MLLLFQCSFRFRALFLVFKILIQVPEVIDFLVSLLCKLTNRAYHSLYSYRSFLFQFFTGTFL